MRSNRHRMRNRRCIGITAFWAWAIILLATATGSQAANVTLAWDSNAESDLAGYIVYYGTVSRNYPNSVDVGMVNSYQVTNLTAGQTYYFAVTAYDSQGNESAFSNEIPHSIPAVDTDGDGLSDSDEVNVYQTDPNLADTDGDGLTDGSEVTLFGTDPLSTDTDQDGLSDAAEINNHGTNPNLADTDQDGLLDPDEINTHQTDPNQADSDQDGLTDGSEINVHGTDPNNADTDQDGLSDGFEVSNGLDPLVDQNAPPPNDDPLKPMLLLPGNGQTNITQIPVLQSDAFEDPDGDAHTATHWQISTDSNFGHMVYSLNSSKYLTALPVPEALLDIQTRYYWRVRYYDSHNAASAWADPFFFTTVPTSMQDQDQNGVPDANEVDADVDLDENDVPDVQQPNLLCATTAGGDRLIGLSPDSNVRQVNVFMPLDAGAMDQRSGTPANMPYGVVGFRIEVNQPGDTAYVTIHLSQAAGDDARWYKFDLANGWYDYTSYATFGPNRRQVTLRLTDGGIGDGDGVRNGVIFDPSGLAGAGGEEELFKACFVSVAAAQDHPLKPKTASLSIGMGLFMVCALVQLFRLRRSRSR